jgi:hypothetical protein
MHRPALQERQSLTHKPPHPLPQCIVPPFHMVPQTRLLADRFVLIRRDHRPVCCPEIRVAQCLLISTRYGPPQTLARVLAAVARHKRHHLPGHSAQRNPYPALVLLVMHERPKFVQLEHTIFRRWWDERVVQGWEFSSPFLIHVVTVWRLTPKVRVSPRRLERSW